MNVPDGKNNPACSVQPEARRNSSERGHGPGSLGTQYFGEDEAHLLSMALMTERNNKVATVNFVVSQDWKRWIPFYIYQLHQSMNENTKVLYLNHIGTRGFSALLKRLRFS